MIFIFRWSETLHDPIHCINARRSTARSAEVTARLRYAPCVLLLVWALLSPIISLPREVRGGFLQCTEPAASPQGRTWVDRGPPKPNRERRKQWPYPERERSKKWSPAGLYLLSKRSEWTVRKPPLRNEKNNR